MKKILVQVINFYQTFLSFDRGLLAFFTPGGVCKFEISCSEYTKQAILKHGAIKGVLLGAKRIWGCR